MGKRESNAFPYAPPLCRRFSPIPRGIPTPQQCTAPDDLPDLPFHANDFLERDDIGIDLAQNPHDAVRANTSIQAATLVDVVSGDTYAPCLPRAYRLKIYRFDEHLAI